MHPEDVSKKFYLEDIGSRYRRVQLPYITVKYDLNFVPDYKKWQNECDGEIILLMRSNGRLY